MIKIIRLPTLIFAECVLTYIDVESSSKFIGSLCKWFSDLSFLNYEMFNPNDQFGKMMVKNFQVIFDVMI